MTTPSIATGTSIPTMAQRRGRIGLVVLGSITSGFVLGLLLVLVAFAGGEEAEITGSALLALGTGFMLLAVASSRFTDQPQRWALAPGVASAVVGLAILVLSPGNRALDLAGWVWPVLLLVLVSWSFRGRTPFSPQLVTSRTALPVARHPLARRGRRCL
jgi:hypothetical protein